MKLLKSLGFTLVFTLAVSFGTGTSLVHAENTDAVSQLKAQIQELMLKLQAMQSGGGNQNTGGSGKPDTSVTKSYYCPSLNSVSLSRGPRDGGERGGSEVSELQKFLASYFNLDQEEIVTGYFGTITKGYVARFQKENNVKATGTIGELTRAAIAKHCGGTQGSGLLKFIYPNPNVKDATISLSSLPVTVKWSSISQEVQNKFPNGWIELSIVDYNGVTVANFAKGYRLYETSATINSIADLTLAQPVSYRPTPGMKYKIRAILESESTGEAKREVSESQWVTYIAGVIPSTTSFSATPTSGSAPLTVTFKISTASAGGDNFDFGDGFNACSIQGAVMDEGGCTAPISTPFTHTYTKPGTYKVTHSRSLPSTILGTSLITVTDNSAPYLTEQVKCVFGGATTEQRCYAVVAPGSTSGEYGCSGVGSCTMTVGGQKGKTIEWKSSCGTNARTMVDGTDKYANFSCSTQNTGNVSLSFTTDKTTYSSGDNIIFNVNVKNNTSSNITYQVSSCGATNPFYVYFNNGNYKLSFQQPGCTNVIQKTVSLVPSQSATYGFTGKVLDYSNSLNSNSVSLGMDLETSVGKITATKNVLIKSSTVNATPTATIDQSSLKDFATYPTFTGSATGVTSIRLEISQISGTTLIQPRSVPVINGKWSFKAGTEAPRGSYRVIVFEDIGPHDNMLAQAVYTATTPTATIDQSSLVAYTHHPIITGTSKNGTVAVAVKSNGVIRCGDQLNGVNVVNGRWSFDACPAPAFEGLGNGEYQVVVHDAYRGDLIVSGSLTVKEAPTQTPTAIIDQSSLYQSKGLFNVTGSASNAKSLQIIMVTGNYSGATDWNSANAAVKANSIYNVNSTARVENGRWSGVFGNSNATGGVPNGTYTLLVYDLSNDTVTPRILPKLLTRATLTVKKPAPAIFSITPSSGPVGTEVIIRGIGFTGQDIIRFGSGGKRIANTSGDGTTIRYTIPYYVSSCDLWDSITTPCPQGLGATLVWPSSYSISVSNTNGTSAEAVFVVTASTTTSTSTPVSALDQQRIDQLSSAISALKKLIDNFGR